MAWTVCTHGGQGCVMLTRMLSLARATRRASPSSKKDSGQVPYGTRPTGTNFQGPQISALSA